MFKITAKITTKNHDENHDENHRLTLRLISINICREGKQNKMERTLAQLFRGYNQGYNLEPANTINGFVYLSTLDRVAHQGYNLEPTNTING